MIMLSFCLFLPLFFSFSLSLTLPFPSFSQTSLPPKLPSLSLTGQIYLKLTADKQAEASGHGVSNGVGGVGHDHFSDNGGMNSNLGSNIPDGMMPPPASHHHDSLASKFRGKIQNVRPSAPSDLV